MALLRFGRRPGRQRAIRGKFRDHTEEVRTHPRPGTRIPSLDSARCKVLPSLPGSWLEALLRHRSPATLPHGRPISDPGLLGRPAMPRDATTPLEGGYTDNDSWSTDWPQLSGPGRMLV